MHAHLSRICRVNKVVVSLYSVRLSQLFVYYLFFFLMLMYKLQSTEDSSTWLVVRIRSAENGHSLSLCFCLIRRDFRPSRIQRDTKTLLTRQIRCLNTRYGIQNYKAAINVYDFRYIHQLQEDVDLNKRWNYSNTCKLENEPSQPSIFICPNRKCLQQ